MAEVEELEPNRHAQSTTHAYGDNLPAQLSVQGSDFRSQKYTDREKGSRHVAAAFKAKQRNIGRGLAAAEAR